MNDLKNTLDRIEHRSRNIGYINALSDMTHELTVSAIPQHAQHCMLLRLEYLFRRLSDTPPPHPSPRADSGGCEVIET